MNEIQKIKYNRINSKLNIFFHTLKIVDNQYDSIFLTKYDKIVMIIDKEDKVLLIYQNYIPKGIDIDVFSNYACSVLGFNDDEHKIKIL